MSLTQADDVVDVTVNGDLGCKVRVCLGVEQLAVNHFARFVFLPVGHGPAVSELCKDLGEVRRGTGYYGLILIPFECQLRGDGTH